MSSENTRKIKEVQGWIDDAGDYLKDMQMISHHVETRRFRGDELVAAVGVSSLATIHIAQKEGRLPKPDLNEKNRRMGATLEQILEMQEYFGTSPRRADSELAQTISFINFKGGCYKSTTSLYAATYFATLGHRVCMVDLDPQATLTLLSGLFPDIDSSYETSLAPYILDDEEFQENDIFSIIQKTSLPNLDIIPSCLELAGVEFNLSNEVVEARIAEDSEAMANVFYRVRNALEKIKSEYDIIILDGTPSLGLLPLNIIMASDAVIVPVPTEPADFASTRSFCKLYAQQAKILDEAFGDGIELPEMYILPTRYSPSEKTATVSSQEILSAVRDIFGSKCFDTVVRKHDSVVSNLSSLRRTAFDVNAGDCNVSREARRKAMTNFSTVFDEILEKVIYPAWESKREMLAERGLV